jgi:hypothetical protein
MVIVNILASTSVPYRPTMVQVPNSALSCHETHNCAYPMFCMYTGTLQCSVQAMSIIEDDVPVKEIIDMKQLGIKVSSDDYMYNI